MITSSTRKKPSHAFVLILIVLLTASSATTTASAASTTTIDRPTETSDPNIILGSAQNGAEDGNVALALTADIFDYTERNELYARDFAGVRIGAYGTTRQGIVYTPESHEQHWYQASEPTYIVDDDSGTWIDLSYPFVFYSVAYTRVFVCSNGFLSFIDGSTSPTPNILDKATPNALVAGFWTDLDPSNHIEPESAIRYYGGVLDEDENSYYVFAVTWDCVLDKNTDERNTFQIALRQDIDSVTYPNAIHGEVFVSYQRIRAVGVSYAIGVENQGGLGGTKYDLIPQDGTCLRFCTSWTPLEPSMLNIKVLKPYDDTSACVEFGLNQPMAGVNAVPAPVPPILDFGSIVIGIMGIIFGLVVSVACAPAGGAMLAASAGLLADGVFFFADQAHEYEHYLASLDPDAIDSEDCHYDDIQGWFNVQCRLDEPGPGEVFFTDSCIMLTIDWTFADDPDNTNQHEVAHTITLIAEFVYKDPDTGQTWTESTNVDLFIGLHPPTFSVVPSVSNPVQAGSTVNLIWQPYDVYPVTYTIRRMFHHHNPRFIDEWEDIQGYTYVPYTRGQTIEYTIQSIGLGDWAYSCQISDTAGRWANNEIRLVVPPQYTAQAQSVSYTQYSTGNTLSWSALAYMPTSYKIQRDDVVVQEGTWTNGTIITKDLDADNLAAGTYIYSCTVFDIAGSNATSSATVTVYDNPPPVFTVIPSDKAFERGTTGNTLTWQARDLHTPGTYEITYYPDGHANEPCTWPGGSGTWTNSTQIAINIDSLPTATWWFICSVSDAYGNAASDIVKVTVVNVPPAFTYVPNDVTVETGQSFTLKWRATDGSPSNWVIKLGGSQVASGTWSSGTDIIYTSSLGSTGTYTYTITVYDNVGGSASDSVTVSVVYDATAPVFTYTQPNIVRNLGSSFTLTWKATDKTPYNYVIYRGGTQVKTGSWSSGASITYTDVLYSTGTYTYTIVLYDQYGHSSSASAYVTIKSYN